MGIFKKRKTILALGGGGARGLCSIGVLKVLDRYFNGNRKLFDMVVGTSMGSLVGAAYCLGIPPEEMEEKALRFSWPNIVDLGMNPTGLVKGVKFTNVIIDTINEKTFNDIKIPFALTTTDIETGEELIHTSGDLVALIRASCSWPGIFSAVEVEGRVLVDGGVRNSIPTKAARKLGGTHILAINPGFNIKKEKMKNAIKSLVQSVQIMGEELNAYQSAIADVTIKPELEGIDQFEFDKAGVIIKQGELAAEQSIREIKKKLGFR